MHTPNQSPIYLIALGAFALGMASYVTAGLIPMIEASFAVSVAVAAQLVTAFTLAYGLGSPIFVALTPAHRQRAGLLLAQLQYGRITEILDTGLHAYLTQFLDRVNLLGGQISRDFLAPELV